MQQENNAEKRNNEETNKKTAKKDRNHEIQVFSGRKMKTKKLENKYTPENFIPLFYPKSFVQYYTELLSQWQPARS